MDDHTDVSSTEIFERLSVIYRKFANSTDVARALIRRKQNNGETLAEPTNRMMKLARIAYQDAEQRESQEVQVHLAEYFIDGLSSSFIKEDIAMANPVSLSGVFTVARESERLYERLNPSQRCR